MRLGDQLINILYKAATSSRRTKVLLTPLGLVFFFAFTGLFIVTSLWLDRLLEFPNPFSSLWSIAVSIPILVIGLFFILWSMLYFAKARGTGVPFNPPPKVVTTGPYAYIRNPMLTGWFIFLFGLGILLGSISLVFIFTPLFILLMIVHLKTIEEPELAKRLGQEYLEYKNRVPMFIPLDFFLKKL